MCGKSVSKTNEFLSAKSWMYFAKSPSKIVKKPRWLFSKPTKWATCSVPMASDLRCSLVSDHGLPYELRGEAIAPVT